MEDFEQRGCSVLHSVQSGTVLAVARRYSRRYMDPLEGQARAIIAAALIVRGAVEVPSIPSDDQQTSDPAGVRLTELTDYVYRLVTTDYA